MIKFKIVEGGQNFLNSREEDYVRNEAFKICQEIRNMLEMSEYTKLFTCPIIAVEYTSNLYRDLLNVKLTISYKNANVTIDTFKRVISISWCNYSSIYLEWHTGYYAAVNLVSFLNKLDAFRELIEIGSHKEFIMD